MKTYITIMTEETLSSVSTKYEAESVKDCMAIIDLWRDSMMGIAQGNVTVRPLVMDQMYYMEIHGPSLIQMMVYVSLEG